jgi:cobalt-zinc-cadmium efflux system protein
MGVGHAHGHGHGKAHAHGQGHGHAHGQARHTPAASAAHAEDDSARRLRWALVLTLAFLVVELVAGFWTHSLTLLSDAGHMLTDSGALALALFAQRLASRPRTRAHTFGYRRAEILSALINGVVLALTSGWIVIEAIQRMSQPPKIVVVPMLIVAVVGLLVNLLSAFVLGHGANRDNPNVRAALLHVASDALGSVAAIVAGLGILWFDARLADPVASLFISLLIALGAIRLVRETLSILMEATPMGVDIDELERVVSETRGVLGFHDLHAWSISEGFPAVTVHVVLDGTAHGTDVAHAVGQRIRERFGISHVTVQPEAPPPEHQVVPVERLTKRARKS